MDKTLDDFGFKKTGLYNWYKIPFQVTLYYDSVTISKIDDKGDGIVLYEGVKPLDKRNRIELIERYTKFKIENKDIEKLLDNTKAKRIFSNTSLFIANSLINYIQMYNITDEELCKELNDLDPEIGVDKEKIKKYLTGSYNFSLSELSTISILIAKIITIK